MSGKLVIGQENLDGWLAGNFTSFSTVCQSYQEDGRTIMNDCVQWKPVYN